MCDIWFILRLFIVFIIWILLFFNVVIWIGFFSIGICFIILIWLNFKVFVYICIICFIFLFIGVNIVVGIIVVDICFIVKVRRIVIFVYILEGKNRKMNNVFGLMEFYLVCIFLW